MRTWLQHAPPTRRMVLVAVLGITGFASWWWLSEQRESAETAVRERHPDSYFHELDVVRHDSKGNPEMRLTAEYAEHFENEPWIHLRELDATGLAEGLDWRLSADAGQLTDDGVHLEAWGDVVLTRTGTTVDENAAEETSDMHLRTARLFVNTDTRIAKTEAPVTITHGAGVISGIGMEASLQDDRLVLKSDVEARYGK